MKSEYQKHFKVSALRKSLPLYYENVAFRTARREREYAHTPVSWYTEEKNDDESVDSDRGDDSGSDLNDDSLQVPTVTKKRLVAEREEWSDDDDHPTESPLVHDEKSSSMPTSAEREHSQTQLTVGANDSRIMKQRRPDRRQKVPCPVSKLHGPRSGKKQPQIKNSKRSTTSAGVRSQTSTSSKLRRSTTPAAEAKAQHPAPFMSYGWAGAGRDLSQHKTFNIRATADVYPAALRAHSRRTTAAQQKEASAQKTKEDRVQALLNSAANERANHEIEWTSEYRQQYPAYSEGEYSRSLFARANERKLCRIVYVS